MLLRVGLPLAAAHTAEESATGGGRRPLLAVVLLTAAETPEPEAPVPEVGAAREPWEASAPTAHCHRAMVNGYEGNPGSGWCCAARIVDYLSDQHCYSLQPQAPGWGVSEISPSAFLRGGF